MNTHETEMLQKQADDRREVEQLLEWCSLPKFSTAHEFGWRNLIAADLNNLVARVGWTLMAHGEADDRDFAHAAKRIIERVADFEKIRRESGPHPKSG
jgi:hypothetical protein